MTVNEQRDALDAQTESERLSGDYYDQCLEARQARADSRDTQ